MFQALSESNFYEKSFESYNDRCGFGTGCLYAGVTNEGELTFQNVPFGSYVASEDANGKVNMLQRLYTMTAVQCRDFFGESALTKELIDALDDEKLRYTKQFNVLHTVREREHFLPGNLGPKQMPYESVYVLKDTGAILEESGMQEFPFMVSRFVKMASVYGYAPAMRCFPDIVGIQRTARIQSLLAELQAFPRMKVPAELSGRVNFRPGGITYVKANQGDALQEFATRGSYPTAVEERQHYADAINEAYFIPDLNLFESVKRQMTATEVAERADERLNIFAQTFCQFISDLRPLMERIFNLLYRSGQFSPAPEQVLVASRKTGNLVPQVPEIVYTSKFAQKIREVQTQGMTNFLGVVGNMMQLGQAGASVLDRYDLDFCAQELARGYGVPEKMIRSDGKMQEYRQQVAEMKMNQMLMQQQLQQQQGPVQQGQSMQ
jgi:hypothetical protein